MSSEEKSENSRDDKTYFSAKEQTTDDSADAKPKQKSKTKAEVLEDNARLRKEKKEANERAAERDDRLSLGESIGEKVRKLKGLRDSRMMAASEYKSNILLASAGIEGETAESCRAARMRRKRRVAFDIV